MELAPGAPNGKTFSSIKFPLSPPVGLQPSDEVPAVRGMVMAARSAFIVHLSKGAWKKKGGKGCMRGREREKGVDPHSAMNEETYCTRQIIHTTLSTTSLLARFIFLFPPLDGKVLILQTLAPSQR